MKNYAIFLALLFTNISHAVELARDGKALLPIVLAPEVSPEVEEQAKILADGLKRITGAAFEIRREASGKGIQFGTSADWPGLLPDKPADLSEVLCRETYLLQSHEQGLRIIGRTPLALQNAVWDFFYRLGFRQFFPGPNWEIWPELPDAQISVDTVQSPDFYTRKIFLGGSTWPENRAAFDKWQIRNRMVSGFTLNTGHAYKQIIARNPVAFSSHPEYIANPKGEQPKFDPSKPQVLEVAARDALEQLRSNPAFDSVSMDPSDGGGWREDSPLGSPSNQAVTLANHVARVIQKDYPGRKVGIYAYNQHSPPPDIPVDPNVIVSVATSFLRGGYTPEKLISEWRAKGAEIGLREYLSVFTWDKNLPGRARAADLEYVTRTIRHYYDLGVRYWITEASNAWGPHGLGYYLTSRLLWDVDEAKRKDEIINDFLERSFEEAAPEMREFYRLISGENRPLLSEDLLGRMYRLLDKALKKTNSPAVERRLLDLVAYTHYIDLDLAYRNASGAERQAAFEKLAEFAYLTRSTDICSSLHVVRGNANRDKQIQPILKEGQTRIPRFDNLPPPDLAAILRDGVENKKLNDFVPVAFSKNLVPFEKESLQPGVANPAPVRIRGVTKLYVFADSPQSEFTFDAKGAILYQNLGPVSFKLYSPLHAIVDEAVAAAEIPADKEWHRVTLKSPYEGLHILEISDGNAATELTWPAGQRVSFPASPEESVTLSLPGDWVFYVPKGTKVLGLHAGHLSGSLLSPDGKEALALKKLKAPGTFSIPVPPEMDGKYWVFQQVREQPLLMTVPPYFARSAAELLVPEEALPERENE